MGTRVDVDCDVESGMPIAERQYWGFSIARVDAQSECFAQVAGWDGFARAVVRDRRGGVRCALIAAIGQ